MNKQAIAEVVHAKLAGTKAQAEEVVDMIIDSIVSTRSAPLFKQGVIMEIMVFTQKAD